MPRTAKTDDEDRGGAGSDSKVGGNDWYSCAGVSSCYDAPWNGSRTVPFLGVQGTAAGCQAACEAMADCLAVRPTTRHTIRSIISKFKESVGSLGMRC